MKKELEKSFSRQELADFLLELAQQLQTGQLRVEERVWSVPEVLGVRVLLKEKKGRLVLKLQGGWNTLGDYGPEEHEAVSRWQGSFKEVKKRLGASFAELQRQVRQGGFPEDQVVQEFVESSRAMANLAEPEWLAAMEEYRGHLENFQRALQSRQQEVMRHELQDLHNCMAACHREFK
jgi:XXXCH domain-containing protein